MASGREMKVLVEGKKERRRVMRGVYLKDEQMENKVEYDIMRET